MDPVVLLHGLWLNALSMEALGAKMSAQGFSPRSLGYQSTHAAPETEVARLAEQVDALSQKTGKPVHLVGHSMGGVLALRLAQAHPDAVGRIVCLGSPLLGSRAAQGVARLPGGLRLLGGAGHLLNGLSRCPDTARVGMIAGSLPLGLGAFTTRLPFPHDGTVSVAETYLPGLHDHVIVRACHTQLPFSAKVATLAGQFLRGGFFARR